MYMLITFIICHGLILCNMGKFELSIWKSWMQPVQKLIGMNIKIARTKRSVTQAEVASRIGIEASYLSRIERGTVPVSCERIYEIMHVLHCDISEIFPLLEEVET